MAGMEDAEFQEWVDMLKEDSQREEDYPGLHDQIRREKIILKAVQAADRIIMDYSSGDTEETDYLTGAVAQKFVEKVQGRLQSQLLRLDLTKRR